jgi:hypothetical protein
LEEQNKELKVKSKYSNKGLLNKNKEKKESIAKSIPLKYLIKMTYTIFIINKLMKELKGESHMKKPYKNS